MAALGSLATDKAVARLIEMASGGDHNVATTAISALGGAATPASEAALRKLLDSPDSRVVAAAIGAFESMWEEKGYGLFAVELLDSRRLIDFAGLAEPAFLPEVMPAVEVGWRFAREAWGQGFATEAARAAIDFGLGTLRLPEIVSIHQVGNHASARIMQKLGMCFDRQLVDRTCGRLVRVYRTSGPSASD